MRQPAAFIDPVQLMRIKDLQMLARTVVEGFMTGIHKSPHTGASLEFAQYRAYTQGDDLRYLDWKLYGRSDRLYLKQFREESNLRCTLVLDCSGSMAYGSAAVAKFQYACMLAASLATVLVAQGDAVGLAAYHEDLIEHLPPARDGRAMRRLYARLASLEPQQTTNSERALATVARMLPARGMVILISDFLEPVEAAIQHLRTLRAQAHDVMAFQVADPAERDFPFEQAVTLLDLEATDELFVVPEAVREGYLANRKAHFDAVAQAAARAEIDLAEFMVDQPLDHALRFFVQQRAKRQMRVKTGRPRAGRGGH